MTEDMAGSREAAEEGRGDYVGAKMGMWIFLFTELLLFGGMFLLYSVYRSKYPVDFHRSAADLDLFLGTTNTVVLLTSSLTMVLAIATMKRGNRNRSFVWQLTTLSFGLFFLANKYMEWSAHITHGIYPDSAVLLAMSRGEIIFFSLYFVMTGIHGLHVLIGIGAIAATMLFTVRQRITPHAFVKLENTGLYWHFVDIIWIYLFPLFYLIT
jgi:cytochrome c oxidase subunit 3